MTKKKHYAHTGDILPCTPAQPYPFITDARQLPYHRTNKQIPNQTRSKDTEKNSIYETNKSELPKLKKKVMKQQPKLKSGMKQQPKLKIMKQQPKLTIKTF